MKLEQQVTSLELSKKLKEAGFGDKQKEYDILNDLCVKYSKELFGEGGWFCYDCSKHVKIEDVEFCISCAECDSGRVTVRSGSHTVGEKVLHLMQEGTQKDEIEDYIWENCKFNPKYKLINLDSTK